MLRGTTLGVLALLGATAAGYGLGESSDRASPLDARGGERPAAPRSPALRRSADLALQFAPPAAPGGAAPRRHAARSIGRGSGLVVVDDALAPEAVAVVQRAGPGFRLDDVPRADGVLRVLSGASDAAIVTREPNAGERRRGIAEQRLGDLIAVVVAHPDNPLGAISSAALRDLLRGVIVDWAELGGLPGPIRLVLPAATAEADLYARLLARGDRLSARAGAVDSDLARLAIVAEDTSAVTIVPLAAAERAGQTPLRIDAIAPSLAALRSGRYPFAAPIVLVHRGLDAGRALAAALDEPGPRAALEAFVTVDPR